MESMFPTHRTPSSMKPNPKSIPCFASAAVALCCLSSTGLAVDNVWNGGTTDWNTTTNWSLGVLPIAPDDALVNMAAGNFPYVTAANAATPQDIIIGRDAGNSGRVDHVSGTLTAGGWFFAGRSAGTGVYNLADVTTVGSGVTGYGQGSGSLSSGWIWIGGTDWEAGGVGTMNVNTTGTVAANGNLVVGSGANAVSPGNGTLNIDAGTVTTTGELWVGDWYSQGTMNVAGTAAITVNSWLAVGRRSGTGVLNMTGGSVTKAGGGNVTISTGTGGSGTVNQSGGVFTNTSSLTFLGESWNGDGNGMWNLSGTGQALLGEIIMGNGGASQGTFNLNGGLLQATRIRDNTTGATTFNFNGGTLRAGANQTAFMEGLTAANVMAGGAVIDTNGFAVTIAQSLLDGDAGGNGDTLVKRGAGALLLTGTNTFTGAITVEGGALAGRSTASLPGWNTADHITVKSGGALGASLGAGGFSQADFETLLSAADMQAGSSVAISTSLADVTYATDVSALPTGLGSAVGLHKLGGNTLSIDMSQQTFTGNIVSSGGVLRLTNSAAASYAGTITTTGNLRVDGGNGALVLTGAPAATVNGELWVGSTPDVAANLVLENTSLAVTSWIALGRGNGNTGTLSSITATNSTITSANFSTGFWNNLPNDSDQNVTLTNSTWTNNGATLLAESANATTTMVIEGNSAFNAGARFQIGLGDNSLATVTVKDSATLTKTGGDWVSIGNSGALGTGILNIQDNAVASFSDVDFNVSDVGTSRGTVNISGAGTLNVAGIAFIGKNTGTSGTVNLTGGTFNAGRWVPIGRFNGSTGVVNVSGGTLNQTNTGESIIVGEEGTGTLTISGTGAVNAAGPAVLISNNATGTGTVNLDGGTLTARQVTAGAGGAGSATLNFNGGLLVAGAGANASFVNTLDAANVLAGGARIDTNGQAVAVDQALLDGGGGGGLTKSGAGTLILAGNNTYTGATSVTQGTLTVNGSTAASSLTTVDPGATLMGNGTVGAALVSDTAHVAPGNTIGTLNVTGDIDIEGVLDIEYDGLASQTIDVLNVTGILDITDATVDFAQLDNPLTGPVYVFATYGTLVGDEFDTVIDLPDTFPYYIDYQYGDLNQIALVIPEPSAALLGALGLLALLRRRRA